MGYLTVDPQKVSTPELHGYLLGAVAPRPIAFASTIDKSGRVNLSPYSFFNAFSANPPMLVFSPARRVRDNTTKHTLENVEELPEVVINICDYSMAEQMSLASTEYDKGVNEFVKAGFTEAKSKKVSPPRVLEAPVSMECLVERVVKLGDQGGAGNLIFCRVLLVHVNERILDENKKIDPYKLDAIGRMGGDWYVRANGEALFTIPKPLRQKGIGVDQIPGHIRLSKILTGNQLGRLGNVEKFPEAEEINAWQQKPEVLNILDDRNLSEEERQEALHRLAANLLDKNQTEDAWKVLLQNATFS
ncbi:MAG TPA: flavin reductase [Cytophagales bacterium]|jgi:flavin reductase (DIM6/NTAB) family NADH-FMN oxidoreductase RutF|nr:flavin reductase [Cytophagales bacterium]